MCAVAEGWAKPLLRGVVVGGGWGGDTILLRGDTLGSGFLSTGFLCLLEPIERVSVLGSGALCQSQTGMITPLPDAKHGAQHEPARKHTATWS
jgi:hypothetical protein